MLPIIFCIALVVIGLFSGFFMPENEKKLKRIRSSNVAYGSIFILETLIDISLIYVIPKDAHIGLLVVMIITGICIVASTIRENFLENKLRELANEKSNAVS